MKKITIVVLCGLLLSALSLFALAQPVAVTGVQAAPTAPDLSTDLKLQQQKLDFFEKRLDFQDKRIGDLGLYLACFGALMTVIVVFFSLRATREAVREAKDEARKEVAGQAKTLIEQWLRDEGQPLMAAKVEASLRPELDKALAQIDQAASGKLEALEVERQKAIENNAQHAQLNEQHQKIIEDLSSRTLDKDKPLSEEQKQAVDSATEKLQSKPPKEYRFEDWFMLGIQAYESANYEIAAAHFAKASEIATDSVLQAKALVNKGVVLGKMQQHEAAIAVYDEVVRRYGDAPEAALRERVANALNGVGFRLLLQAKAIWQGGEEAAAIALLRQALEKVEAALQRKPDEPIYLGNQGYILFLLGEIEKARVVLSKAIALGGEELRQAELKDADIHPLPQDAEFKALVMSL